MKKFYLFVMAAICSLAMYADPLCTYTLEMYDDYGDGWNGNKLIVEDNGNTQTFTLESDESYKSVPVLAYGETPVVTWEKGSFVSEMRFIFKDPNGVFLYVHDYNRSYVASFELPKPCDPRPVPDMITNLKVSETSDNKFYFSWDATSAEKYYIEIYNPAGKRVYTTVFSANEYDFDAFEEVYNGDWKFGVAPADEDGKPMIDPVMVSFNVHLPALGNVKVRYYVPETSDWDMSKAISITLDDTDGNRTTMSAAQEGDTRWWSATINVGAPAYESTYFQAGTAGTDDPIYMANKYYDRDEAKNTEVCVRVGDFSTESTYSFTTRFYYTDMVECDFDTKDYSIASATCTPTTYGHFVYEITPNKDVAPYYFLEFFVDGKSIGSITRSALTAELSYENPPVTITSWTITPIDESDNPIGPVYESTEAFTIEADPMDILNIQAQPVGDNTYKITWECADEEVTHFEIYLVDPDGYTLINYKLYPVENFAKEGNKFVFITPAFAVEGDAYVNVQKYYENTDYYGDYAYKYFTVDNLNKLTEATIRILIPTDNTYDISGGIWFWWWAADKGFADGQSVKANDEGGRWFSATINPDALGYQFLIVNKEIKTDEDWTGAAQSAYSTPVGTANACFELRDNPNKEDYWFMRETDCAAEDHDYRPTGIDADNSVPGQVTFTVKAKDYPPQYYFGYSVSGKDNYQYQHFKLTAENNSFTLKILVGETTDFDYRICAVDEEGYYITEYETGTFTVQPDPDKCAMNVEYQSLGDGRYKFSWDYNENVTEYYINVEDADGNLVIDEYYLVSMIEREGDRYVFVTPAFAVEGKAEFYIRPYLDDEEGANSSIFFDVTGLTKLTEATIRVLIPTDNDMDISGGVWFWWWPYGESFDNGQLVKPNDEGGRWFSATINPDATGYQFCVVNKEIKTDTDWDDASRSINSGPIGAPTVCFELKTKRSWQSYWSMYYIDCAAKDHDCRATVDIDTSVPGQITITINSKDYAPHYQFDYSVKDKGDYKELYFDNAFTAEHKSFTVDIPVSVATEFDWKLYVNDEFINLYAGPYVGTFTVEPKSGLGDVTLKVLVPDDNNMDLTNGLWVEYTEKDALHSGIQEMTDNGDGWFSTDLTISTLSYSFELWNKNIVIDDKESAQKSAFSGDIEDVTTCVELGYCDMEEPGDKEWLLLFRGCEAKNHDYRATYTINTDEPGKVIVTVDAIDYAASYRVGYRLKGSSDPYEFKVLPYAGSNTFTVDLYNKIDLEIEYVVEARDADGYLVAEREYGEATIPASTIDPPTFNLTLAVSGKGSVNDVSGTYPAGTSVTIIATPDAGWNFDSWSDGNTNATRTILMDKNYNLTAFFSTTEEFMVTITAGEGGSIEPKEYKKVYVTGGTVIEVEAVADDDWTFVKWSDDVETAKRKIVVTEDIDIEAEFEEVEYVMLTVEVDPEGTATVLFDGKTKKNNRIEVEAGSTVTLTFEATEGYEFDHWQDGKQSVSNEKYKVTVNKDKTVTLHMIEVEDIHNVEAQSKPTKILHEGHFYILRDGDIYTITGDKVE